MNDQDIHVVLKLVQQSIYGCHRPFLDGLAQKKPDPFKILIGCVLSLRTRDEVTSEACMRLFALADNPFSMGSLTKAELEKAIYPVGFYRRKTVQIQRICQILCRNYEGRVPDSIEKLLGLDGVGRKTANLVITLGYDKPGICVDVHVHRICNRLGYVRTKKPDETELKLREKLPQKYWKALNQWLVAFGQNRCLPISPHCSNCLLNSHCLRVGVSKFR